VYPRFLPGISQSNSSAHFLAPIEAFTKQRVWIFEMFLSGRIASQTLSGGNFNFGTIVILIENLPTDNICD